MILILAFTYFAVRVNAVGIVSTASPTSLTDGSEEYVIAVRSPNISVVDNFVFVCVAVDVPFGWEESYIVEIKPQPINGMHYHIVTHSCDEPGHLALPDNPPVWECGIDFVYAARNPPLLPGHECMLKETVAYGRFTWQYQGGSVEAGTMTLPTGTGIPVGGKSGPKYIVVSFHYISLNETLNNTTGVSGLDFKLVRNKADIKKVGGLTLGAYGFLQASSVGTLSGSWTLSQDIPIQIRRIYSHWHSMAIGARVSIFRPDGKRERLLEQDPRSYMGYTEVADSSEAVMRPGDTLTLTCTFDNKKPHTVRVEADEMCTVTIFYSVDGNETLSSNVIFSNDKYHAECFNDVPNWGVEINYNGESSYTGPVTHAECHTWESMGL